MWYTPTYENCFVELLDLNGQVNYAHLRKLSEVMVRPKCERLQRISTDAAWW